MARARIAIIRAGLIAALASTAASTVFCQSPAAPPSFEVASVKPAEPSLTGKIMVRMGGDPGRLDYSNVSLRDLIRRAYDVKDFQISGPDWMNSARFDVLAKLPPETPREQIPLMLQGLLAERFKLAVHRETKELPMFALVVGKGGPKMKESEVDPQAGANGKDGGGPSSGAFGGGGFGGGGGGGGGFGGGGGGRGPLGTDGPLPGQGRGPMMAGRGPLMMMNGRGHLAAKMMNMSGLADMLSHQVDRPVIDQTGLKGNYDFTLDYTPEEGQGLFLPGIPPPPPGAAEAPRAANPDSSSGLSLFAAIQAQLGLKLEPKKGPVDLVVVDHLEKVPTEN